MFEPDYELSLPPEHVGGVYANAFFVWHTEHDFTLDFAAVTAPPQGEEDTVPATIVARIRLPVTLLFDVLRALNENMTQYERNWGEIRRPRREGDV